MSTPADPKKENWKTMWVERYAVEEILRTHFGLEPEDQVDFQVDHNYGCCCNCATFDGVEITRKKKKSGKTAA